MNLHTNLDLTEKLKKHLKFSKQWSRESGKLQKTPKVAEHGVGESRTYLESLKEPE